MSSDKKKLKRTFEKVRLLTLATPSAHKQIIGKANRELIDSVCECCNNILKGRVPLKQKEKVKLSKYKNKLRDLAKKKLSLRKKRHIIQKGGFLLGAILTPVVSHLANLLGISIT